MGKAAECPVFAYLWPPLEGAGEDSSVYVPCYGGSLGIGDLARALAVSPFWRGNPEARLILRIDTPPALAAFGRFSATELAALGRLRRCLPGLLRNVRYRDYAGVERDCEILADRLVATCGRDRLRDFTFVAVPRGGYIVLGMLAYLLELEHDQLSLPAADGRRLVVVDDVAVTGHRIRTFLDRLPGANGFIVATLYSRPQLRQAVLSGVEGIGSFVSAHDLADDLTMDHPAGAAGSGQAPDGTPAEHMCFPWKEVDLGFWNPDERDWEYPWRLIPPQRCLSNRHDRAVTRIPVHQQGRGPGPLVASAGVLYGSWRDQVVLGRPDDPTTVGLDGSGGFIWNHLMESGDVDTVVHRIADDFAIDLETARRDVTTFVDDLIERRLVSARR